MQQKTPKWIHPKFPSLSEDELIGEAAVDGQMVTYPKISRGINDPSIPGQSYGTIGIRLFSKPCVLSTGKNVYGFFKIRGNYPDVFQAQEHASNIIKDFDSHTTTLVCPVGSWLPITEEQGFCKEVVNVKDEEVLTDTEKEAKKNREKIYNELKRREKELVESKDIYEDEDTLDFYTMKQVTLLNLIEEKRRLEEKTLPNIIEKIQETKEKIASLSKSHPDYEGKWEENYNKERAKAGIPPYKHPKGEETQVTEIPYSQITHEQYSKDSEKEGKITEIISKK